MQCKNMNPTALFLLLAASCSLFTQQVAGQSARTDEEANFRRKPRIAVLPFETASDFVKSVGLAEAITGMAVTELRNNSNFIAIERSQLRAIIDEKALVEMGLTQAISEKLINVLDVEVILMGEVAYLEKTIHIDARMVDMRTTRVAVAEFIQTTDLAAIRPVIRSLIRRMLLDYLLPWMGSLTIASDPAGAEVYIDGDYAGKTARRRPVRVEDLIEGQYRVKIIAGGFEDWEGTITVLPKMSQTFNIPLIAKPGSMSISSEPSEAEVFLDNNLVGTTPVTLKKVTEGEHDLRIVKDTYKVWSRKVHVRSFQPTDVTVSLEVMPAMMIVRSEPSGALVYFMGKQRGTTPVSLSNLIPGEVVLRLTKKDYDEWVSAFVLAPNERREIDATLARQIGLLSVATIPAGAEVYLSTEDVESPIFIGAAPVFNYKTTVGNYRVELQKKDYFTSSVRVSVEKEKLAEVSLELEEKPGQIFVETTPENAQVFLNDVFMGRSPLLIKDVKRGTYGVQLRLPYARADGEVTIEPDRTTRISRRLQKSRSYVGSAFAASLVTVLLYLSVGV